MSPYQFSVIQHPTMFQSAPRGFPRGDRRHVRRPRRHRCFNPRPVVSHGATGIGGGGGGGMCVSIRAPWFPTGRHEMRGCLQRLAFVSIRAPWFPTGRQQDNSNSGLTTCFNPRPVVSHGATDDVDTAHAAAAAFQSAPRGFPRGDLQNNG